MPSSKSIVRDLPLSLVPVAAITSLLVTFGYASDESWSVLVYVAAPAAVLSAGLLTLSRWLPRRHERRGWPEPSKDRERPAGIPGGGDAHGPVQARPVPAAPAPGYGATAQGSRAPRPDGDRPEWDGGWNDVAFGGFGQPVAAGSWGSAASGAAPAATDAGVVAVAVAGPPRVRVMTVLAELSGCLSLVVSVIALIKGD